VLAVAALSLSLDLPVHRAKSMSVFPTQSGERGPPAGKIKISRSTRQSWKGNRALWCRLDFQRCGNEGGQTVADVLFGDFNSSGKLPFTYPRRPKGLITYDHEAFETEDTSFGDMAFTPQFEFGHGLSYTTFA